ncbi:hypothetical protein [Prevotella falsenii]|uniref:hypothetical protein n=1 Tax=Prevotella falsenii TaxID=515414 RepID=UPI000468B94C|nr:hypothetical protein [Prevotella falsenii]
MHNNSNNEPAYRTLNEIRLRKAQLLTDITKESKQISTLWDGMFHKPQKSSAPTKRLSGLMATGVGVADAVILGWKLYRRISGKPSLFGFFGKKRGKR